MPAAAWRTKRLREEYGFMTMGCLVTAARKAAGDLSVISSNFSMNPFLIYCYDAYCGWCYGFSPVIRRIVGEFRGRLPVEVLSGGMIIGERPLSIKQSAGYIR